jgi:hypothetical protein
VENGSEVLAGSIERLGNLLDGAYDQLIVVPGDGAKACCGGEWILDGAEWTSLVGNGVVGESDGLEFANTKADEDLCACLWSGNCEKTMLDCRGLLFSSRRMLICVGL